MRVKVLLPSLFVAVLMFSGCLRVVAPRTDSRPVLYVKSFGVAETEPFAVLQLHRCGIDYEGAHAFSASDRNEPLATGTTVTVFYRIESIQNRTDGANRNSAEALSLSCPDEANPSTSLISTGEIVWLTYVLEQPSERARFRREGKPEIGRILFPESGWPRRCVREASFDLPRATLQGVFTTEEGPRPTLEVRSDVPKRSDGHRTLHADAPESVEVQLFWEHDARGSDDRPLIQAHEVPPPAASRSSVVAKRPATPPAKPPAKPKLPSVPRGRP